jgi:hypothetical protein
MDFARSSGETPFLFFKVLSPPKERSSVIILPPPFAS